MRIGVHASVCEWVSASGVFRALVRACVCVVYVWVGVWVCGWVGGCTCVFVCCSAPLSSYSVCSPNMAPRNIPSSISTVRTCLNRLCVHSVVVCECLHVRAFVCRRACVSGCVGDLGFGSARRSTNLRTGEKARVRHTQTYARTQTQTYIPANRSPSAYSGSWYRCCACAMVLVSILFPFFPPPVWAGGRVIRGESLITGR